MGYVRKRHMRRRIGQVPNFILQPLLENSLLHGLKSTGYRGKVVISAQKEDCGMGICIRDSENGFAAGKKKVIDAMLADYEKETTEAGRKQYWYSKHTEAHQTVVWQRIWTLVYGE